MHLKLVTIIACVVTFCPQSYCEIEDYFGKKYVMVSHENFNDYLIYLGYGYLNRRTALAMRPEISVSKNSDGSYTRTFKSKLVDHSVNFNIGEEFEYVRPGGDKIVSIITIEDDKLIEIEKQKKDGKTLKHTWEFSPKKLTVTTTAEGLEKNMKRHFVLKE